MPAIFFYNKNHTHHRRSRGFRGLVFQALGDGNPFLTQNKHSEGIILNVMHGTNQRFFSIVVNRACL